jgi:spoIIIJ-associated protein
MSEDRVEGSGRSVEEALQSALGRLGARREDVRWDVLDPGHARLLGLLGTRPARVRVERLVQRHAGVRELVEALLGTLDIPGTVEVSREADSMTVSIRAGELDGLLIGRRGETLAALQHVIGRLVSRAFDFTGTVTVDVGAYRRRRDEQLTEKARVLAAKVQATGREIHFEPLHAHDRRIVHGALTGMRGVRTYTVGHGLHRNVVIAPDHRNAP